MPDMAQAAIDSALAIAYVEERRLEDAHRVLAKFADGGFELPPDSVWLLSIATYADVAIACRDREMAGPLFDLLAPFAGQLSTNGGATVDGPVSHFLGVFAPCSGATTMQLRISRRPPCSTRGPGHLLRCPDRPPLGSDAGRTRSCGRHREGTNAAREGVHPCYDPRVRGHRVALDASAPRSRLTCRRAGHTVP